VASNLSIHPNFPFIQQKILPYRSFKKGAFSIAVIGGTNGDVFYKWVVKGDIRFKNAQKSINKYARRLKGESDLNIALSHMGFHGDKKLAASSRYIDLIVGGHNHIKLDRPVFIKNRSRKPIPIFQLGDHGRYVGEILIDVDRSKPHGSRAKLISYNVHPIPHDGEKDQAIIDKISETLSVLDQFYGANYLHDVLLNTTIPLESSNSRPTYWTTFFTDAIREEAMADLALNSSTFFGPTQASGEITRLKVMNFFPHFFDLKKREGWTIYTAEVKGHLIKNLINLSYAAGYPFLVSGVSFETKISRTGKKYVVNLKISDRPIDPLKSYKIAIPEGYYLGLHNSVPALAQQILRHAVDTEISIWSAVSHKIQSANTQMVMKE
jgi:2',3'-cyclic-nucleotide 2'-phosphodiesterase (5'-nucleotidase family)